LEDGDEKSKSEIYEEDREIRYREFTEWAKNSSTRKPKPFTVTDVRTSLLWKQLAEP